MIASALLGEEQGPAYQVLLELACLLEEYRENVVIIGGWCAYLLATHYLVARPVRTPARRRRGPKDESAPPHVGSKDVDLLINVSGLLRSDMMEIRQLLLGAGYKERADGAPFRLVRELDGHSKTKVLVDLMIPDPWWPRRARIAERDLWVITVDGGSLPTRYALPVVLRGNLPSGRSAEATVNVMGFPGFLTLKGLALGDRRTRGPLSKYQKNAYDIAFVIDACEPRRVAAEVATARSETEGHEHEELMRGLSEIHADFHSREAGGPDAAAVVYASGDEELQPGYARRAFEAVASFLEELGYTVQR